MEFIPLQKTTAMLFFYLFYADKNSIINGKTRQKENLF